MYAALTEAQIHPSAVYQELLFVVHSSAAARAAARAALGAAAAHHGLLTVTAAGVPAVPERSVIQQTQLAAVLQAEQWEPRVACSATQGSQHSRQTILTTAVLLANA